LQVSIKELDKSRIYIPGDEDDEICYKKLPGEGGSVDDAGRFV